MGPRFPSWVRELARPGPATDDLGCLIAQALRLITQVTLVFPALIPSACNCRHGKYIYTDGTVYEGEWKQNTRSGRGMCSYSNGNKYTGIAHTNFVSFLRLMTIYQPFLPQASGRTMCPMALADACEFSTPALIIRLDKYSKMLITIVQVRCRRSI